MIYYIEYRFFLMNTARTLWLACDDRVDDVFVDGVSHKSQLSSADTWRNVQTITMLTTEFSVAVQCSNVQQKVSVALQPIHCALPPALRNISNRSFTAGRRSVSFCMKQEAHQLVGQAKRRATKIRPKVVGGDIFGRLFRTSMLIGNGW